MRVAGVYSFKDGERAVAHRYPDLLTEVNEAVKVVDAARHKTKRSTEKTMTGRMLFSPASLNRAFKRAFSERGAIRPHPLRLSDRLLRGGL